MAHLAGGAPVRFRRTEDGKWQQTGTSAPPAEVWWRQGEWIVLKVPGYSDYAGGGETIYLPAEFTFGTVASEDEREMTLRLVGGFPATPQGRRSQWAPSGTVREG